MMNQRSKATELSINPNTNLLEQDPYSYQLQDVQEPELFRLIYPYTEVPKVPFNYRRVPMNMPEDIFITDTSFRDGQQSRTPYTTKQMVDIYKMLHRLGGKKGMIRQTEFFVYSIMSSPRLQPGYVHQSRISNLPRTSV